MKVTFVKLNAAQHTVTIVRDDASTESVVLESKTYFLHDISHFVVEQELALDQGFWGMLNRGYGFVELSGKTNPLTEELRRIECIVGGIQSVYSGHQTIAGYFQYLDAMEIFVEDKSFVERSLVKIDVLNSKFKHLEIGQALNLQFFI